MHDVGAAAPDFIRKGDNVTVTIGRNIGTFPMNDAAWQKFQDDVTETLVDYLAPSASFTYHGQGEWEGVTEDSAVILAVDIQHTILAEALEVRLGFLATRYAQDAIGWSFGAGRLAR